MFYPLYLLPLTAILIGLLAWLKNRNPLLWGLVGVATYPFGPFFVLFCRYLCPQCKNVLANSEWEQGRCTKCGERLEGRTRVLGRCVTFGAVASVLGTIPLAGVVGYFYQFPVPFSGVARGSDAIESAMVAAVFYSALGGALVQAAAGGLAGSLAYAAGWLARALEPRSAGLVYSLAGVFGVASAVPGVLLVANAV